jgi:hypothetical protein
MPSGPAKVYSSGVRCGQGVMRGTKGFRAADNLGGYRADSRTI